MNKFFKKMMIAYLDFCFKRPYFSLLFLLILCVPSFFQIQKIKLDTNLIRLLPTTSPAASLTRELSGQVSDGGYFAVMLSFHKPEILLQATQELVAVFEKDPDIRQVEYTYPVDFIRQYQYLLIPQQYLLAIEELIMQWKRQVNPLTIDFLEDEDTEKNSYAENEKQKDIEFFLKQYGQLPDYHLSEDKKTQGILVYPKKGVTNLGSTKKIFDRLDAAAKKIEEKYSDKTLSEQLTVSIGGSSRNKINIYDVIISDLNISGIVAGFAILLVLAVSFRSLLILPVLLLPLFIGLLWAFSFVPNLVGDLNTITSFLLLVLFGMGIDYSVHFLKRFQSELNNHQFKKALSETFIGTGGSVLISALTTAFSLGILYVSEFRGFSEFGLIGLLSMLMIGAAMFLVMPPLIIIWFRFKLIKPLRSISRHYYIPKKNMTIFLLLSSFVLGFFMWSRLEFDYDFSNLDVSLSHMDQIKEQQGKIYKNSISPAALYVAENLEVLDTFLSTLQNSAKQPNSKIGRVMSVRDYVPDDADLLTRKTMLRGIQESLQEKWVQRVEDPQKQKWIRDVISWKIPEQKPTFETLPPIIKSRLTTADDSGQYLISLYPNVQRKNGKNSMAFTKDLYDIKVPAGIKGPIGETPVFAEVLWIVTEEGPWLILFTFIGIGLIILVLRRSLTEMLWVLFPLVLGVCLTFGIVALFGMKINFFNIVVIPTLLGVGVDHGVHYYHRWVELKNQTQETQNELFEPLSVCTLTTIMGYSGMAFAHHPGLKSIGLLAGLGLMFIWISYLLLFPGILLMYQKHLAKRANVK